VHTTKQNKSCSASPVAVKLRIVRMLLPAIKTTHMAQSFVCHETCLAA
jgi:hypothetical protein